MSGVHIFSGTAKYVKKTGWQIHVSIFEVHNKGTQIVLTPATLVATLLSFSMYLHSTKNENKVFNSGFL